MNSLQECLTHMWWRWGNVKNKQKLYFFFFLGKKITTRKKTDFGEAVTATQT